jgi:LmbE family N-acetylglucosaminyl deacetylase
MILGIAAHHDDLAIGAGGYLIDASKNQQVQLVVLVSNYLVGGTEARIEALQQSARDYQWQLSILDFRDCEIIVSAKAAIHLGNLIQKLDPDRLIVPAPGRHMDHASVCILVKQALRLTNQARSFFLCDAYKGLLPSVEHLYYHDITQVVDEKLRMITSLSHGQHAQETVDYVRALSIVRGLEANTSHAEAFSLISSGGSF